jgi:GH25 family lysozyme M1 (1,4-beta-N-acetylmuramidase)
MVWRMAKGGVDPSGDKKMIQWWVACLIGIPFGFIGAIIGCAIYDWWGNKHRARMYQTMSDLRNHIDGK